MKKSVIVILFLLLSVTSFWADNLRVELKELSNSTSSLTNALKTISSQNKFLVKELSAEKESITFP